MTLMEISPSCPNVIYLYQQKIMSYIYIESNHRLLSYINRLEERKVTTIALDIEAENNPACLWAEIVFVQVFDGLNAVLIDPFKVDPKITQNYSLKKPPYLKVM
jgi:ribonuclease D